MSEKERLLAIGQGKGIAFLLDHLGLDELGNEVCALREAEMIVRIVADSDAREDDGACVYCGTFGEHIDYCPQRLAREWVAAHPSQPG